MSTTLAIELSNPTADHEAELAAIAFLARYSDRTLESYRYDLRSFFQWAADVGLDVLAATRSHIELFRSSLQERGLAPATIDRQLSTICGFYRFAHIDGRIASNPAQYVRRPTVHRSEGRGLGRTELGSFLFGAEALDHHHAALAVLLGLNGLRVSEACATDIEDLGLERGHRTLRIIGKGAKPAVIPLVPRTARTIDLAVGERSSGPILRRSDGQRLDRRTAHRWVRSIGRRAGLGHVHPHMLRAAFIMAALDAGVPLRDVQLAARHADPRTTTVHDHRRQGLDRHAALRRHCLRRGRLTAAGCRTGGYRRSMAGSEIVFVVDEAPEGGYVARAVGESIITEADNLDSLREMVRDAVVCHFDEDERPKVVRLHLVRDELLAV